MSIGGGGPGRQKLQELSEQIQALEEEKETVRDEIEDLEAEKTEIDEAIEGIETLESGSTVQVPLGGGAYLRADVEDIDEVIVELGGGYAAEQAQGDAVDVLENKKENLDDRIDGLQSEIAEIEAESQELEQEAQQAQQQMLQQQMQQQGGGQGGQPDE
jgi:prefoldin alpha subunit